MNLYTGCGNSRDSTQLASRQVEQLDEALLTVGSHIAPNYKQGPVGGEINS
jgi:hypothetical protein